METVTLALAGACVAAAVFGAVAGGVVWQWALAARRGRRAVASSGVDGPLVARVVRSGVRILREPARRLLGIRPLERFAQRLCAGFESLGWPSAPESALSLVIAGVLGLFVLASLVALSPVSGCVAAACFVLCCGVWAGHREEAVRTGMREAIPEALQSMKACFQVGYSLPQTIAEVRKGTTGPLSELFGEVEGVLETGGNVDDALEVLKEKSHEPELVFLSAALEIQHKTGSSMAAVLEATRQSITDEIELKRELRTQTAQAKLSAQVVTLMPFFLIGVFSLVSPGFLDPFFESVAGLVLLGVALGMQALGIVMVRKMLKVEVA